jgi:glycolate oxidase FAD binding subunit
MKLLIGSYGTLAVITSASFKLFPAPRQTSTFLAEFVSAREAVEFRDRVMSSPFSPMCLELVSPRARRLLPEMTGDAWVVCVRAAGSDVVLTRYRRELGATITREVEGENETKVWRAIQNFPDSAQLFGDDSLDSAINQRIQITVPPGRILPALEALDALAVNAKLALAMTGRIAVGHLQAAVWNGNRDTSQALNEVVAALQKTAGDDLAIRVDCASNPWPIPPASLASMRSVKQALDPNNVLRARNIF